MPDSVSIIIITYNRPVDLLELLQSLGKQESLDNLSETLILNNASTVSYEEVESFLQVHTRLNGKMIKSSKNLGVAGGRNLLMQQSVGSLLLVLDDDVIFSKQDDFAVLTRLFEKPFFKKAKTAVITPRVIYHDNKQVQKTAFPHKNFDVYKNQHQFLTSYYIGCAHLMKAEALKKAGLYPENFFYGMEEYDLGYRIISQGYSIGYDDEVTIEHKESSLGRQPNYQKLQMQWVNKSKVAWRYLPFIYFVTTSLAWSFEYLFKIKGHIGSYFKGWKEILAIPFKEKRSPINKSSLQYLKKTDARLWY